MEHNHDYDAMRMSDNDDNDDDDRNPGMYSTVLLSGVVFKTRIQSDIGISIMLSTLPTVGIGASIWIEGDSESGEASQSDD
jgi:hypothetical protein